MTAPVDLTNLRSMIDGNKEIEKLLLKEFFTSFEACIKDMQADWDKNGGEAWRSSAHALKGIAVNVGAMKLGELCKKAQDSYSGTVPAKKELLKQISAEYQRVHAFLLTQM